MFDKILYSIVIERPKENDISRTQFKESLVWNVSNDGNVNKIGTVVQDFKPVALREIQNSRISF